MANVRFYFGTQAKFDALVEKNPIALYFIDDTQRLYKGDVLIAAGADATTMASGLMSAKDKARLDELVAASGNLDLTAVDGTIKLEDTTSGKSISVSISANDGNALIAVEDGLFVTSIEIADEANGLRLVDGTLSLALATEDTAGALSAADKTFIGSIPSVYATQEMNKTICEQVKYEISNKPVGTIVDCREKEIRVTCPADTKWELQNSGDGSDASMYYIGFKAYAPDDSIVSFKEDLAKTISDNTMYYFNDNEFAGIDKYNRKYSIVWLPVAMFDTASSAWTYFGDNSTNEKYIGWDYSVEWYNADGVVIHKDTIRINLLNENIEDSIVPYYMNNYATIDQINKLEETMVWNEIVEY